MYVKRMLSAGCCFIVCCFAAHAPKKHAAAAMTDQQFVIFAAETDMTEAHLAQMAADRASAQAVKTYAQMLATDHTSDYNQLSTVARKANLTVPNGLDPTHDKMVLPFQALKGAAFDARYIHEMVAGHTNAVAVYTREAANARNADVKAYANQALPTLQKHLDGAKDLSKGTRSRKKR